METKHTPGPWHIVQIGKPKKDNGNCGKHEISCLAGAAIGHIDVWFSDNFPVKNAEEARANAKLIVAAPDMLEALLEVYAEMPDYALCFEKVKIAIAKATE